VGLGENRVDARQLPAQIDRPTPAQLAAVDLAGREHRRQVQPGLQYRALVVAQVSAIPREDSYLSVDCSIGSPFALTACRVRGGPGGAAWACVYWARA
jgi:hypothetical protein